MTLASQQVQLVRMLRSSTFVQANGRLRKGSCFCFGGLLCEAYRRATGRGRWIHATTGWSFALGSHESNVLVPREVCEWSGFTNETLDFLVLLNDQGATFPELAQRIEAGCMVEAGILSYSQTERT